MSKSAVANLKKGSSSPLLSGMSSGQYEVLYKPEGEMNRYELRVMAKRRKKGAKTIIYFD